MTEYSECFHVCEIKYWKHKYNYGIEHNVRKFKAVLHKKYVWIWYLSPTRHILTENVHL